MFNVDLICKHIKINYPNLAKYLRPVVTDLGLSTLNFRINNKIFSNLYLNDEDSYVSFFFNDKFFNNKQLFSIKLSFDNSVSDYTRHFLNIIDLYIKKDKKFMRMFLKLMKTLLFYTKYNNLVNIYNDLSEFKIEMNIDYDITYTLTHEYVDKNLGIEPLIKAPILVTIGKNSNYSITSFFSRLLFDFVNNSINVINYDVISRRFEFNYNRNVYINSNSNTILFSNDDKFTFILHFINNKSIITFLKTFFNNRDYRKSFLSIYKKHKSKYRKSLPILNGGFVYNLTVNNITKNLELDVDEHLDIINKDVKITFEPKNYKMKMT